MLKIDKIDETIIRIQKDSIHVLVPGIFFASCGEGGMIIISPKNTGAFRSFSSPIGEVEINGISGSEYTQEEAAKLLNSFIGNFKSGGSSSVTTDLEDKLNLLKH